MSTRTKIMDVLPDSAEDWGIVARATGAGELVEVEAGRWRAVDVCGETHLAAAQRIALEIDRLWSEVEAMAADAAARGLRVPWELRERLSVGARGLPVVRRLHAELQAIVCPVPA